MKKILKEKDKILEAEAAYYESLYKKTNERDDNSDFFQLPITKLSEEHKFQC